jgi:hypothetical protein
MSFRIRRISFQLLETVRLYAQQTHGNLPYLNDQPAFHFCRAIVLFLLAITLADPDESEAVIGRWWI